MVKILYFKILGYHIVLDRHPRYEAIEKYGTIVPKVLSFPYKYFFVWTDHMVLLYEDPDIILSRKKERTKQEIKDYYLSIKKYLQDEDIKYTQIKNRDINETCSRIFMLLESL